MPAGESHVTVDYRPRTFYGALPASLAGVLLLLIDPFKGSRQQRSHSKEGCPAGSPKPWNRGWGAPVVPGSQHAGCSFQDDGNPNLHSSLCNAGKLVRAGIEIEGVPLRRVPGGRRLLKARVLKARVLKARGLNLSLHSNLCITGPTGNRPDCGNSGESRQVVGGPERKTIFERPRRRQSGRESGIGNGTVQLERFPA